MKKLILIILMILVFSFSVQASIIATIGMKGLSFVDPKLASVVGNVMSLSDPTSFVQGQITGKIKQETIGKIQEGFMQEFSKDNPGAVESMNKWNQVKGYIDQGASIVNELKLDDKGEIKEGTIKFDKLSKVGSLVNKDLKDEDIQITKGNMEIKERISIVTLAEGGNLNIKGNLYMNIENGAQFRVEKKTGELVSATFKSKGGEYYFGAQRIKVPAGATVNYGLGRITITGVNEFDFSHKGMEADKFDEYNKIKILEGGNIEIQGPSIGGKNFKIGEILVNDGRLELSGNNYILYSGTEVDVNNLVFKSNTRDMVLSLNQNPGGDKYLYLNEKEKIVEFKSIEGGGYLKFNKGNKFVNIQDDNKFELEFDRGDINLVGGEKPNLKLGLIEDNRYKTKIVNGNGVVDLDIYEENIVINSEYNENKLKNMPIKIDMPESRFFNSDLVFDENGLFLTSKGKTNVNYRDHSIDDPSVKFVTDDENCFATNILFKENKFVHGCFSKDESKEISNNLYKLDDTYKKSFSYIDVLDTSEVSKICGKISYACTLDRTVLFKKDYIKDTDKLVHELAHANANKIESLYPKFKENWMEIADAENIYEEYGNPQTLPIGGDLRGCCSVYGCTSYEEDLAECVELSFKDPKKFSKFINNNVRYGAKLDLLCKYNFIPKNSCDEIRAGSKK